LMKINMLTNTTTLHVNPYDNQDGIPGYNPDDNT
jgi:hypothetical protein